MSLILGILESVILIALSLIHFNWVFGGTWGLNNALPTTESGKRVLNPKKIHSGIVAIGLLTFGMFYLIKTGIILMPIPTWIFNYTSWFIAIIFSTRAIGDFRYVGFFKRIKKTKFGKLDSKCFSPLCLCIAMIAMLLELLS